TIISYKSATAVVIVRWQIGASDNLAIVWQGSASRLIEGKVHTGYGIITASIAHEEHFLPCGSHQQHVQIVRESMSNVEQCHIHVGDDAGHICDGDGGWIWISWPRCCTLAGNSDGRWIGKSLGCCQHRKYGD